MTQNYVACQISQGFNINFRMYGKSRMNMEMTSRQVQEYQKCTSQIVYLFRLTQVISHTKNAPYKW